jgi:hypothetical protein
MNRFLSILTILFIGATLGWSQSAGLPYNPNTGEVPGNLTFTGNTTFEQPVTIGEITSNTTFLGTVFIGNSNVQISSFSPPFWGDFETIDIWQNGEGIFFCQNWGNGFTFITANDGIGFVVDSNSDAANEGAMIMDTVPRAGAGFGFGFDGGLGMIYGDVGAPAHWAKEASISPDLRRLYVNNTTFSLDWLNRNLEGNWTANGTTFAATGNFTERGSQLSRWRGTATSDPPTPEAGDIYLNTTTNKVRIYGGSAWIDLN